MTAKTLWIAQTTVATAAEAERLARLMIDGRHAACVQVDDCVRSHYRWKGQIEAAAEWRLTFKTPSSHLARLREAILAAHPYETPEWIAWPLAEVSEAYLKWAQAQVD